MKKLKAFQVTVDGRILDYRLGQTLDLAEARAYFGTKYKVNKLWSGGRHVLGILEKERKEYFLKLATTEGISEVTKREYRWNEIFNRLIPREDTNFWVPQNLASGLYQEKLFYLITDKFSGLALVERPGKTEIPADFRELIPQIIQFSELIQALPIDHLNDQEEDDYRRRFLTKTSLWFEAIPQNIREKYQVIILLKIVQGGVNLLEKKPRHGDFTPWHLMKLASGQLGLIDGEHAMANGVEYYDVAYFLQRVYAELQNPSLADQILHLLSERKYNLEKLRIVLAARAIGGFLDESLKPHPDYVLAERFQRYVINLKKNYES